MIQRRDESDPTVRDDLRHELKLTADRWELSRVRGWLRVHPAGFVTTYPARQVNSIYFDTPGLTSYYENLSGVPSRCKLRLRWYGADLERFNGILELKVKNGLCGWKPQHGLSRDLVLDKGTWPEFLRDVSRELPCRWRGYLQTACLPIILITYQREYYQSMDGRIRATIDYDQRAYDQRRSVRPNTTWPAQLESRVILELKAPVSERRYLADVAADFPLRTDRSSKYVAGVQSIYSY